MTLIVPLALITMGACVDVGVLDVTASLPGVAPGWETYCVEHTPRMGRAIVGVVASAPDTVTVRWHCREQQPDSGALVRCTYVQP